MTAHFWTALYLRCLLLNYSCWGTGSMDQGGLYACFLPCVDSVSLCAGDGSSGHRKLTSYSDTQLLPWSHSKNWSCLPQAETSQHWSNVDQSWKYTNSKDKWLWSFNSNAIKTVSNGISFTQEKYIFTYAA